MGKILILACGEIQVRRLNCCADHPSKSGPLWKLELSSTPSTTSHSVSVLLSQHMTTTKIWAVSFSDKNFTEDVRVGHKLVILVAFVYPLIAILSDFVIGTHVYVSKAV